MRSRSSAAILAVLTVVVLAGCGEAFDPLSEEVAAARGRATGRIRDTVDAVVAGLAVTAERDVDSCEPGQDNWKVTDPYEYRCGLGRVVVAELPGTDPAVGTQAAHDALIRGGCTSSDDPLHPYTRALQDAVPVADPAVEADRRVEPLAGEVPDPANPPSGCVFHPRCPLVEDVCRSVDPELAELLPAHLAACHVAARRVAQVST